jgi:hypothetical protein
MAGYPCGPCTFCPTVVDGHGLVEVDRVPPTPSPKGRASPEVGGVPDGIASLGGITCDGRWRVLVALCPQHRALLARAGSTGRVHGASGVRWWFPPS